MKNHFNQDLDHQSDKKTSKPSHKNKSLFADERVIHEIKHYLPAQAPLKDFVHHNTLHAFQNLRWEEAINRASEIFGYKVSLSLQEYRDFYAQGRISDDILEKVITDRKGKEKLLEWKQKTVLEPYESGILPRIGTLRSHWKYEYHLDLDSLVHPLLFRILCNYLDQGISIWSFPIAHKGFLTSMRNMERHSYSSFFKTPLVRNLFLHTHCKLEKLLDTLIGDETLYEQYLFDQQFAHQGWSGIVSAIEDHPETLLDNKFITLHDLIVFELLLEIDALEYELRGNWQPLGKTLKKRPAELLGETHLSERNEILLIWQEALEFSYYDQVLAGLQHTQKNQTFLPQTEPRSFQALFCIDDRECSIRRYVERVDTCAETFGTPGFFNVEFYFKPEHGKFYTKLCPVPVNPKYLIKETATRHKNRKDLHFTKQSHSLLRGFIISQILGFWSAFKLFLTIFRPTMSPATSYSFRHMDKYGKLSIENKKPEHQENGWQIGFTIDEMVLRVEGLLKSIGLVNNFADLIYVIGHGSSSVNNPHYSAYDCGACSGRPGSVNARVVCYMANHPEVRKKLVAKGIQIPSNTQFVGGLHDTTRDEIMFFDEDNISTQNLPKHQANFKVFQKSLDQNTKERSRRFKSVNTKLSATQTHQQILNRSVSLFEPRPELNHATNALCIVGRRELTKHLFLDRRSFLNSYNYALDLDGTFLFNVMKPLGPVCGGINLEYYFSRVDNQKLGAGTKLPHNVMGLFGVANGIEGDLRPGLPSQMIEVHDPLRLLIIVEHFPEIVLRTIQKMPEMYEWYINEWVHLAVIHPETKDLYWFKDGEFRLYTPFTEQLQRVENIIPLIESNEENFPVYLID
ncbi:MAG: DUF2309 domain-containing protein [Microscillaceae bacterium]|jgi:hypothetical protein|nr:DUF2309 domain-containing protein [Microscillaceae bacterium]